MTPKVTILMSVYNDKKHLVECIESVLNQSYSDFLFLIYDDASTDGSKEILQYYATKDKRIELVLNIENKGLSYNLAEGVLKTESKWIARMDADDIAFKDRLKEQLNYIELNPHIDIVGSYVIDIDNNGEEIELRKVPSTHEKISKLIWTCPFIHPSVLFKVEAIKRAGSYDANLRRRQDYDLWFRCLKTNLRFANIEKPLVYYRMTDEYYKKNNTRVQIDQAKMGYKGSFKVNASPLAYVGVTIAFIKGVLPYKLRKPLSEALKKFDPRRV
ncbi:glycosyltransferase [Shouchella sp. 1P09AA]|uniref:glycosyltransferase n=1 Tax=unclassified Shouchella TaxID=2893065 RepID=UPI0039A161C7